MKVTTIVQYSIFLPNRPGALARLAQLFADAGINMVGIASEVRDDSGLVRVAFDGEGDFSSVLSKAGFASVENRLLSVEVDDKPGQLARITGRLAEAGVNITTVYGTAFGHNVSRILIAVDKLDPAFQALTGV
ncbi:MAG: ACT domain-containing protein [Elusimicrobia bacterium]|nr:ACT domain-containing protein [Elusimicrobiota bacterium]